MRWSSVWSAMFYWRDFLRENLDVVSLVRKMAKIYLKSMSLISLESHLALDFLLSAWCDFDLVDAIMV